MPRPIEAVINLSALSHNLNEIKQQVAGEFIWSVIKANAYGHGIENVFPGSVTTDGFALLDLEEAVKLRELGWNGPILLLEGFFDSTDIDLLLRYKLTTAVHSKWQLDALSHYAEGHPVDVYLKINTGMNRLGFNIKDVDAVINSVITNPGVRSLTLMTHFASADTCEGTAEPMLYMRELSKRYALPLCVANSAASLWHSGTHAGPVRPGIILYGASPSGKWQDISNTELRPVMTLTSQVLAVQKIEKGEKVGYGGNFVAEKETVIAIVACGYADGYPRHAPSGTPVLINGKRCPLAGNVSMDMIAVDVSAISGVVPGTSVELWGENLPVDEVAEHAGTLGYELLSALAPRVKIRTVRE